MAKKKKKSVHLPEEIIAEILLRLPVKILLRCRCVCKSWRTVISEPHFASSHFQLTAPSNPKLFFIDSYPEIALSIDFNASLYNDSSFSSRSLDFLPPHSRPLIKGSCRGFLFLQSYAFFYVWNPSTRVSKQIPISPIVSKYRSSYLLFGFTYVSSMDDYLVVLGSYQYKDLIDLEIFSLKENRWKQIEVDSHLPYRAADNTVGGPIAGLILNDSIHWLVYNYETTKNVIAVFDLQEMRMLEIALPEQLYRDSSHVDFDVFVFEGLINAWIVEDQTLQIWVMQEYNVHSSWTKTKTIKYSFDPAPHLYPVYFSNCGEIVGTVDDYHGGLVKFDDEGDLIEYRSYGIFYFQRSKMAMYQESLFSLPGGL